MPLLRFPKWQNFVIVLVLILSKAISAENKEILIFGDSLSAAYNMPVENGWVALLETQLKNSGYSVKIVNASISGETTSGGLARLEQQISQTNPDILVLELGANDGLRGSSLTQMRNNLAKMIHYAMQNKIKVLLVGMHIPPNYGRTYTQKFDQVYTSLAKTQSISFMPFLLVDVATLPQLIQDDGLHPNEKAQPIIMQNILPYITDLLESP